MDLLAKKPEAIQPRIVQTNEHGRLAENGTSSQQEARGSLAGHGIKAEDVHSIGNSAPQLAKFLEEVKQWPEAPNSINYQPVTLQNDQRSSSITTKVEFQEKATAPDIAAIPNQQEAQQRPRASLDILKPAVMNESSPINPQFVAPSFLLLRQASLKMSDLFPTAPMEPKAPVPSTTDLLNNPPLPDLKTWTQPELIKKPQTTLPSASVSKPAPTTLEASQMLRDNLVSYLKALKIKIKEIDKRPITSPNKASYAKLIKELEEKLEIDITGRTFFSKFDQKTIHNISRLLYQADDLLERALKQQSNGYLENAARAYLRSTARIASSGPQNLSMINNLYEESAAASQEAADYFVMADIRNPELRKQFGEFQQTIFFHMAELLAYKANLLNAKAGLSVEKEKTPPYHSINPGIISQLKQAEKDITITEESIRDFQRVNTANNRMSADCFSKMGALRRKVRDEHHQPKYDPKTNMALQAISHFHTASSLFEKYGESYVQAQCHYELGLLLEAMHGVQSKLPSTTLLSTKEKAQQLQRTLNFIEQKKITADFALSTQDQYFDTLRKGIELCNIILNEESALAEATQSRDIFAQNKIEFFLKCDTTAFKYLINALNANDEKTFHQLKDIGFSCCNEDFSMQAEETSTARINFLLKQTIERLSNGIKTNNQELLLLGIFSHNSLQLFNEGQPLHEQNIKVANFFKNYAQELLSAKAIKNAILEKTLLEMGSYLPRSTHDELFLPQIKLKLYQAAIALLLQDPTSSATFLRIAQQVDTSLSLQLPENKNISTAIRLHTLALPVIQSTQNPQLIEHFHNLLEIPLSDYRNDPNYCIVQINQLCQQASNFLQKSLSENDPASFQTGKAFSEVGKTLKEDFQCYESPTIKESLFWHSIASLYYSETTPYNLNQVGDLVRANADLKKIDALNQLSLVAVRNLMIQPEASKLKAILLLQKTSQQAAAEINYTPDSKPLCDLLIDFSSWQSKVEPPIPFAELQAPHLRLSYEEADRLFRQGIEQQDPTSFQIGLSLLEFAEQQIENHLPPLDFLSDSNRFYQKNLMNLYKRYGDVDDAIFMAEKRGNINQLKSLQKEKAALQTALKLNRQLLDSAPSEEKEALFGEVQTTIINADFFRDEAQKYLMGEK